MSREFRDRMIADLKEDIATLKASQDAIHGVMDRGNENSTGSCLLDGVEVLLREVVMHYEAEIENYKENWKSTPEKSA